MGRGLPLPGLYAANAPLSALVAVETCAVTGIQLTLTPQQIHAGEESIMTLGVKNSGSTPCTNLRLRFKLSSSSVRLRGRQEVSIAYLEGGTIQTHPLKLYASEQGAFEVAPTFCTFRSGGRTCRPELPPLMFHVIEPPEEVDPPKEKVDSSEDAVDPNPPRLRKKVLVTLRNILVLLYPDTLSIRRICAESGINSARIDFSTNANNIWHEVLSEAEKSECVDDLLHVVKSEYPKNEQLRQSIDAYRRAK